MKDAVDRLYAVLTAAGCHIWAMVPVGKKNARASPCVWGSADDHHRARAYAVLTGVFDASH